jgi:hypothetical protein
VKAKHWFPIILTVEAVAPIVLVLCVGKGGIQSYFSERGLLLINLVGLAWTTLPYVFLGVLARRLKPLWVMVTFGFSLAMAVSSFSVYWVSLLRHDEETGLLIFFATLAELIIVLIFLLLVLVLNEFIGKKV